MTMQSLLDGTATFLDHLGLGEAPFGVHYSDTLPENAYGPKKGAPISRELEDARALDMQEVMKTFSCVMGNVWLARKKGGAAYISSEEYGCVGGAYYCSMMKPHLRFIEHYVSTGYEGTPLHGERYMPDPDAMRAFMEEVNPREAPGKYCIFKPLSLFTDETKPEFVIFFARPEVLSGLFTQAVFATGDMDCVVSPFGAGCTNMVSWPLYYKGKGLEKAVIGGFDPSARKFMKTDELTFTVSLDLYEKMLAALPESMFTHETDWKGVRKKVARSAKAWGEAD
ncbi:DUF169 domain-containing protein [Pseudodesulfovibrio indicus]|uniref:Uncharacterized protein (DUF169 family) n=1 Tax=Pseudodesulfovibrio indicus TaxID=1716143 RepID=A0A126QR50_9BACT|nr:DUF169 domain-containing protein [Pseudodesulfovibrio indicus]AMK12461.1 hypothetical protein AWY79_15810 [Pseudodesulfovibrio indicus]TDT90765.1 uncharacterized protein (DUF169 family) [Pseudodesulfovibrio indicus]